jgi:transposase
VINVPKQIELELSPEERDKLEWARDNHEKPYIRERCAALLKIANGWSGLQVALEGLLKRRDPDTVYDWVDRYKAEGFEGLFIKPGRGRKPAYADEHDEEGVAREELLHLVRREPRQFGVERSRWTLAALRQVCDWLGDCTLPGVWQILDRLGIHYKQARSYIHSPDPNYEAKLQDVDIRIGQAKQNPDSYVVLFQDELTYYRQPTLAKAYEEVGKIQPLARRSHESNTQRRIAATLDVLSGRVTYLQRSKIGVKALVDFYQQVHQVYSDVETIYMVQDNWPIHFHPDVLAALRPQELKWPVHVPSNWPDEPTPRARYLDLPIELVQLPTYASWTNPTEKLWRWLKQEVLHLHRYADRWHELWEKVSKFLDQFVEGSSELLRYVGLQSRDNLYGPALAAAEGTVLLPN